MKYFGYTRLSSVNQIGKNGEYRQEETINNYAKENDIEITHIYNEQVSGTKDVDKREVFQQMVSDILRDDSDGVKSIIVEDLSRLARSYAVAESLMIYLASKDITLINARTGEDVTKAIVDDPMKKAIIQIQSVFNELEKSLLVKKLKNSRQRIKQKTGKCEGRKSYSQTNPKLIKRINELKKTNTLSNIPKILTEEGFKTSTNKEIRLCHVKNIAYKKTLTLK